MILRTQLKEGQDFDDPSTIYFAKSNMQSGILFVLVLKTCYNQVNRHSATQSAFAFINLQVQNYIVVQLVEHSS